MFGKTRFPSDILSRKLCVVIALLAINIRLTPVAADDASEKKTAAVRVMHDEVAKLKLTVERGGQKVAAELKPEPILHYSDPERAFPDATLWVWTVNGLPAVFSKLERIAGTVPQWQYCLATANEERVAARWQDGIVWRSRRAGFQFRQLEQRERPKETLPLRLVQLRAVARRFRATTTDDENQTEEMRMLTQPLLRYSNEAESLIDGAVFGVASNGTNPDALLLIQVRKPKNEAQPIWEYRCLGLSGDMVAIELDGNAVYKHAGAPGPGDHGHWLWLVEPID